MDEAAGPYRMTPLEIARGIVLSNGTNEPPPPLRVTTDETPRAALERIIAAALVVDPCLVAFSGGRDSSALLAVAVHVARKEGLPVPVPVTRRFPGVADADETQWQELVVRHLGLSDWEIVEVKDNELDLIGPVAGARLERQGVTWTPLSHQDHSIVRRARGGTVIDGEGGDQLFTRSFHRAGMIADLLEHPRRLARPRRVARAAMTLAPLSMRQRAEARRARGFGIEWLTPDAQRALERDHARDQAGRPFDYRRSIRQLPRQRPLQLALATRAFFAAERDVRYSYPFLDLSFIDSLAADASWRGLGRRSVAMEHLVGDLLPRAILERSTKARYNRVLFGPLSRAFAMVWDGSGIDAALVRPEALRATWLAPAPHGRSAALLQAAWLNSRPNGRNA